MTVFLAAAMMLVIEPASLAADPSQQQQHSVARPAALALTRLLSSEEIIVGHHAGPQTVEAMEATMRSQLGDMEKRRPGLSRAVAMEMQPIIVRSARERLPDLWQREAMIYAAAFNDAELKALAEFFASDVGQRVLAAGVSAASADASTAELSRRPARQPSMRAIRADMRAAEQAIAKALSPQDLVMWEAFNRSDLGRRLNKLDDRVAKVVLAWANENAPWEETELERAVGRALANFNGGEAK